jgi:hypothetical protein
VVSKKHGHGKKRRKKHPALPPGWPKPRPALMAILAEQGVTEADWKRIQKARVIVNEVSDGIAARGGNVAYVVMQVVADPKPEIPPLLPADEY